MTAFNAVRFRVKPGRDREFLDAHNKIGATWQGLVHANIIKTGDRSYCIIAEWQDMDACIKARPDMIATLNSFRDTLEDLGGGIGVTDPVAGRVILSVKWRGTEPGSSGAPMAVRKAGARDPLRSEFGRRSKRQSTIVD